MKPSLNHNVVSFFLYTIIHSIISFIVNVVNTYENQLLNAKRGNLSSKIDLDKSVILISKRYERFYSLLYPDKCQ